MVCVLTGAGILVWTMVSAGAGMDGGGRPYVSMRFWGALATQEVSY